MLNVYREIMNPNGIGSPFIERTLGLENPLSGVLSDSSIYTSNVFAILHVRFGHEFAVKTLNSCISRISDLYDMDLDVLLSDEVTIDTITAIDALVISGLEHIFFEEFIRRLIRTSDGDCSLLKKRYNF